MGEFRGAPLIPPTQEGSSPGSGDLGHLLTNLSHRLILAPQTTAYLPVAQLRVLREYLGDPLIPKLPGWPRNHSLAQFLPGRSGINAVSLAPKGEGGVILQNPITRLRATFLGIYQSMIQDRRSKFLERVHNGLDYPFFQCALTSQLPYALFILCPCVPSFLCGQDGEDRVKTRSQGAYFWPSPMQGNEQWG